MLDRMYGARNCKLLRRNTLSSGMVVRRPDCANARRKRRTNRRCRSFSRFADDLAWWTEAAKAQRQRKAPPY